VKGIAWQWDLYGGDPAVGLYVCNDLLCFAEGHAATCVGPADTSLVSSAPKA
jgi:hypothetical protein